MHLKDNIKSFINDDGYCISIYANYIHLFNYENIEKFNEKEIIVKFKLFLLKIEGKNFFAKQMLKNEITIKGNIKGINFVYE